MVHFIILMISFTWIYIFTFTNGNAACPNTSSYTIIRGCDGDIQHGSNIFIDFLAIKKLCSCEANITFTGKLSANISITPASVNNGSVSCGTQIVVTYPYENESAYRCRGGRKTYHVHIGEVFEIEIRYENGTSNDSYAFHFCPQLQSYDKRVFSVVCRSSVGSSTYITSMVKQSTVQNTTDLSKPQMTVIINDNEKKNNESIHWYIIGAAGGLAITMLAVVVIILCKRRKRKSKAKKDDYTNKTQQAEKLLHFNINDDGLTENPLYELSKSEENGRHYSTAKDHDIHSNSTAKCDLMQECKNVNEAPIYAMPNKNK